jgi:hypothetical protein
MTLGARAGDDAGRFGILTMLASPPEDGSTAAFGCVVVLLTG